MTTCAQCGGELRNGFDALIHAFEHGAEHNPTVSPEGQALAAAVEKGTP